MLISPADATGPPPICGPSGRAAPLRSQVGRGKLHDHRRFLTPRPYGTQLPAVMLWGCVMEQEFYLGLAQRVRVIAERADPFTRRRLLDLAMRYDAKGRPASRSGATERPLPTPRTTPASIFSGPGEA